MRVQWSKNSVKAAAPSHVAVEDHAPGHRLEEDVVAEVSGPDPFGHRVIHALKVLLPSHPRERKRGVLVEVARKRLLRSRWPHNQDQAQAKGREQGRVRVQTRNV